MRKPLLFILIFFIFAITTEAKTLRLSDYGTPGDSIDDSSGFQTAIDELFTSGGGTLVITEGIWDVEKGLNLVNSSTAANIRISGNKGALIRLALPEDATFLNIPGPCL